MNYTIRKKKQILHLVPKSYFRIERFMEVLQKNLKVEKEIAITYCTFCSKY